MRYIRELKVVYGDSTNSLSGQDINKGFGGQYVYLVPSYTDDRKKAVCAFSFHTSYVEDLCADDLSKGDGKELYRYLHSHYRPNGDWSPIGDVWLTEKNNEGQGRTDDLNKDRGGRFLYLSWNYAA